MKIKLLVKLVLILTIVFVASAVFAQETNGSKKLWAASFLNQKAPTLVVEQWISKQPDSIKGKFTLIDFWATWCGPCRAYIPTLNQLQKKYSDNLTIIGISDEPAKIVKAFNNPKIEYFEAIDTKGTTKNALKIIGIPHLILVDPKGIVRWEGFPLLQNFEFNEQVLTALLEKYKN